MKAIKKIVKILLWTLGAVVALALLLLLTLPLWLGPVVKPAANALVPRYTGTEFHLGHLSLNPYTGRFEIGDMELANPSNYSERCAVKLGELDLDVAMSTLGDDVIHIEEITLSDLFVSVVSSGGVGNFKQIQINAAGGYEKYEAEQEKAARESGDAEEIRRVEKERAEREAAGEEAANQKFVIDRITLSGIKVSFGMVAIPVPPLTLTDVGKQSNGATMAEIWEQVCASVLKSSKAVGEAAEKFAKGITDAGVKAVGAGKAGLDATVNAGKTGVDATVNAVKKLDAQAAKDAVKGTTDAVGSALKGTKDAVGGAMDGAGGAIKDAGNALKGLFK